MSRGRNVLAAVIAAGLVGCAELPPLENGVCGNGVVDPGEDCDGVTAFPEQEFTACGEPGTAFACRQISGGLSICPSGWGAGSDGTCGRGDGTFEFASDVPSGFGFLAVGDSDGDAFPDLVGQTFAGTIEAWRGDDHGAFGSQTVLTVGQITGSPAFGYLDDPDPAAALLDAVVPQALGLFAIRSVAGAGLQPVIFPTFAVDFSSRAIPTALVTTANLAPVITHGIALFERGDGSVGLGTLEGDDVGESVAQVTTPKHLVDLVGSPVHVNLDTATPGEDEPLNGREELLFAFEGETRVHAFRFVVDAEHSTPARVQFLPQVLPALDLPEGYRVAQQVAGDDADLFDLGVAEQNGLRVGDLDGDGATDVIVRATGAGALSPIVVVSFLGNGDGTFRTPFVDTRFDGLREQAAGCPLAEREVGTRWPLAIADVTGDGVAEAVGQHGVYFNVPGLGFCAITPDLVTWLEATVGDFNADGVADVAAVPALSRAIDFRLGTRTGLFNRFQMSVENLPSRLRVGDFDGDLINDVALIEVDPTLPGFQGELAILYGDPAGAPSTRIAMGPVANVMTFEAASSPFDFLGIDATTDIFLQSGLGDGATASIMVGSSQRRMLAPLSLSDAGPEEARIPVALQLGRFRDAAGVVDDRRDVFALAFRRADNETPEGIEAWLVPGRNPTEGERDLAVGKPFQASLAELATFTDFRVGCASYESGDLGPRSAGDAEVIDEIVAIDSTCDEAAASLQGEPHLQVLYLATESGVSLQNFPVAIDPTLRAPRRPRLADIDADGDLDIVIAFAGQPDGTGRALAIYFNQGMVGPEQFVETLVPLGESSNLPIDVVTLNLDDDPQREIAVLLPRQVAFFDTDGSTVTQNEGGLFLLEPILRLTAGDVNRDGIDDLLLSGFFQTTVFLQGRFVAAPEMSSGEMP